MAANLTIFEIPGWTGLKISGRVDSFKDRELIQAIEHLSRSTSRVALDLSEAEFLSLQTLIFLSRLRQELGRKGGELALLRPNHSVRRQIEIFLGNKVLAVYRSIEDLQYGIADQSRAEFQSAPGLMRSLSALN